MNYLFNICETSKKPCVWVISSDENDDEAGYNTCEKCTLKKDNDFCSSRFIVRAFVIKDAVPSIGLFSEEELCPTT